MHNIWANSREEIREMLEDNTLFDMADKGKEGNLRITADGTFEWD